MADDLAHQFDVQLIVGHVASASAVVAAHVNLIPDICAIPAALWYLVLLWESRTGREMRAWFKSLCGNKDGPTA